MAGIVTAWGEARQSPGARERQDALCGPPTSCGEQWVLGTLDIGSLPSLELQLLSRQEFTPSSPIPHTGSLGCWGRGLVGTCTAISQQRN